MSVLLLDKTRKINQLLHNNNSDKVVFNDICTVMGEILESNVMVISYKGKILGMFDESDTPWIQQMMQGAVGEFIDPMLNDRLLGVLSTKENVNMMTLGFDESDVRGFQAMINPIDIAGERLGTMLMYRNSGEYSIDDIILTEYGTTVVSLEMLRSVNEESEEENRKQTVVQSAIASLSYSELQAILCVFKELKSNTKKLDGQVKYGEYGTEGVLVASRIAQQVGITRSVIVNALRKFESAGVIETKSSGMKGTYIKIVNEAVFDEIKKCKRK